MGTGAAEAADEFMSIEAIRVGPRFRRDLGDLDEQPVDGPGSPTSRAEDPRRTLEEEIAFQEAEHRKNLRRHVERGTCPGCAWCRAYQRLVAEGA
jgi:hypothetical protein